MCGLKSSKVDKIFTPEDKLRNKVCEKFKKPTKKELVKKKQIKKTMRTKRVDIDPHMI